MKYIFGTSLLAASLLGLVGGSASAANLVAGTVYSVSDALAGNASPSSLAGLLPGATFIAPSDPLNFNASGGYNIGSFLASGGASSIAYENGVTAATTLDGTLFDFKGMVTVTNGESFVLGHDDGATLVINGATVVSAPGPTSFSTSPFTYTGASGTYSFELVYGECCGAPADLSVSLPLVTPNIPEPATFAILGASLIGLGALRRRA